MHQERKVMIQNSFYEELQQVFIHAMQMVFQLLTVAIRPAPHFLSLPSYF